MKSIKLALLGKDIAHSKSKAMYDDIYNTDIPYSLIDCQSEDEIPPLDEIFSKVDGLSITSPYKKHFLGDVKMTDEVLSLKAINCIRKNDQQYDGTNTDYEALKIIFERDHYYNREIILLGDGSMANITKALLDYNSLQYKQLSRKTDGALENFNLIKISKTKDPLIINSCARVFNYCGELPAGSTFLDYNYSHEFHTKNLSKKVHYVDGLELLKLQAIQATKFWNFPK